MKLPHLKQDKHTEHPRLLLCHIYGLLLLNSQWFYRYNIPFETRHYVPVAWVTPSPGFATWNPPLILQRTSPDCKSWWWRNSGNRNIVVSLCISRKPDQLVLCALYTLSGIIRREEEAEWSISNTMSASDSPFQDVDVSGCMRSS